MRKNKLRLKQEVQNVCWRLRQDTPRIRRARHAHINGQTCVLCKSQLILSCINGPIVGFEIVLEESMN